MAENTNTSRRTLLGAGATLGAAAVAGVGSAQAQAEPRTFVLVHGSWHGGWCWRRGADRLEKRGHKVFAPTLTGLGERVHLLTSAVDLDTHVTDVVNLIKYEGLQNIVLAGHSYAGSIITGVAEQMLPAIGSIVFIDAFLPGNGDTMLSMTTEALRAASLEAKAKGDISRPVVPAAAFKVNEKDQAWVNSKLTAAARAVVHDDQIHRRARQGGEENLHPRGGLSAARVRRMAGKVRCGLELANPRRRGMRPRHHGRQAG